MRQLQKLAAMVGVVTIGILGLQSAAGAQTSYPGPTATVGTSNVTGPSQAPGSSFSGTLCGFAAGATVTFDVNGTSAATGTAGTNGCATFSAALSATSTLSINGGTAIPVSAGANVITASGTSSTGGTQTATYTFSVVTASATATATATALPLTGVDIIAMVGGGLVLVALGFLVVAFTRRRRVA